MLLRLALLGFGALSIYLESIGLQNVFTFVYIVMSLIGVGMVVMVILVFASSPVEEFLLGGKFYKTAQLLRESQSIVSKIFYWTHVVLSGFAGVGFVWFGFFGCALMLAFTTILGFFFRLICRLQLNDIDKSEGRVSRNAS
jgi:hypothetical protein